MISDSFEGDSKMHMRLIRIAVAIVLSAACFARVSAQTDTAVTSTEVATRVSAVEGKAANLNGVVSALQAEVAALQRTVGEQQAQVSQLESKVTSLQATLAAVNANPALAIGPFVSVVQETMDGLRGPHVLFSGANIHVRSGSGVTDDHSALGNASTGLGNLVIGYNEAPLGLEVDRTGAHNLVIGPHHRYGGRGCFVAGSGNAVFGAYSSVTGGTANFAKGAFSTVAGGSANVAERESSSVTGTSRMLVPIDYDAATEGLFDGDP